MNKKHILDQIKELGLLAVLRGPSETLTLKAVDALVGAGVLGIEVTFTTPGAYSVVNKLNKKFGDKIILGMGTLTKAEQVQKAADQGAQFLVSPMYEEELCKAMVNSGLLNMMGSLTPTEVFRSYSMGVDVIKVFPGSVGGPSYIKALRGPFPDIPFMPTGGVSAENAADWFQAGVVAVGAGSKLCPKDLLMKEEFEEITKIAKEFVAVIKTARE
jgi:2-dehydro-3-deoxyphosphogluconate aldolase / (4S)-4-hydroxy-2-oxoglutarate aldolase